MNTLHSILVAAFAATPLFGHGPESGTESPRSPSPFNLVREGAEPNGSPNTGGTPTSIACGDHAEGQIQTGGDDDWWQFTIGQAALLQAVTGPGLGAFGLPSPLGNTIVEVRDSAFALVATNDDYTLAYTSAIVRGSFSFCEVELAPGTYYVSVRAATAALTGTYSLDLRCAAPGLVMMEWAEPNGSPFNSELPTPIQIGQQGDGLIGTQGDRDWWSFLVGSPTALIIETGPSLQRLGNIGDPILELRDSTGLSIATNDDGGVGAYSQILITLQPGQYYAEVGGFGTLTGTYRILLYQAPSGIGATQEASEPNGDPRSSATPTPIACGQLGAGEIVGAGGPAPAGDADWWRFTVTSPTWVTAYTLGDSNPALGAPIGDTELWIYNSSYVQMAYDDDNGVGLFSEASAWLTPGTYYVNVEGYGAGDVGRYLLTLECGGGVPGFARLGGGCAGTNGFAPAMSARSYEQALLGTTFVIDVTRTPANALLSEFIGFSNTMTSSGIPLPFSLGVLGAPGCQLACDPLVSLTASATAAGTAPFALPLPLTTNLAGLVLYAQAMVVDPAANAFGITSSESAAVILGSRF